MDLMISVLVNSLIMSVIMLLLFLFSLFWAKKTSAKVRYIMWIILLIGIIVPFRPILGSGFIQLTTPIQEEFSFRSENGEEQLTESDTMKTETFSQEPEQTYRSDPDLREVDWLGLAGILAVSVWGIGAVIVFCRYMLEYRAFHKAIRRWGTPLSDPLISDQFKMIRERLGISGKKIRLVQCSFVGTPLLTGILRPIIVLPDKSIEDDEMALILEHELTHFIHKDLLVNLLSIFVLSVYWFNPVIHFCIPSLYGDSESYCDETVLKDKDIKYRRFYGETIISMIERGKTKPIALSTCFYSKKLNLKRRLVQIMETKKKLKSISALAVIFVLSLTLLSGSILVFANAKNNTIGVEKAKTIALNDAGLKESDVRFVKAKLDKDDGRKTYDIEFYKGNKEYDYEIDAVSGQILEKDTDIEGYSIPKNAPEKQNTSLIGLKKAKDIALKDAGLKSKNVKFVKETLDYDDGIEIYDIEFYSGNKEYDYEIDARSGKILEKDMEIENFSIPSKKVKNSKNISMKEAKKIALAHAGLKQSEVTFTKAKLDYDDGREVYELEFVTNSKEYSYDIKAKNGKILSHEVEKLEYDDDDQYDD